MAPFFWPPMTRCPSLRAAVALTALAALFACGCAELPYRPVEGALRRGDTAGARAALEAGSKAYGSPARLLLLMDEAALDHYAGDAQASARAVDDADKLIDQLYTISLGSEALGMLTNNMNTPYTGENFERVLLHVVGMLDYASLGERDEALVEARRADDRLKQYAKSVGADKVGYREDALARYLSAVLYEGGDAQDRQDAYLDYKKADEAFDLYAQLYATGKPRRLMADLQRMAAALGEDEDLARFRQRDGVVEAPAPIPGGAELLVLLYDGLAPVKVSRQLNLPAALDDGTVQYFSLALPEFVVRAPGLPRARLVAGGRSADFELFEDVNSIAVRDLRDRMGLVMLKETARAVLKFQAARAIQKKAAEAGEGAQLFAALATNIYGVISSQADIRSWRTLPGRIWLARLAVPSGAVHPYLLLERDGERRDLDLGAQTLRPGEQRFLVQPAF